MCSKEEACVECTSRCLKIHGKKDVSSTPISSFFKPLISKRFREVLLLPPRFVWLMPEVVDQKVVVLEDSNGSQWEVAMSIVNGSLAFEQGWNDFSLAHNLDVGFFLVFHCITKSHFVVKIFDTSGCIKLDFPESSNRRKRKRDDGDAAKEDLPRSNGRSSMKKGDLSSSPKSVLNDKTNEGLNGVDNVEEALGVLANLSHGKDTSGRCETVSKLEKFDDSYQIIDRDLGSQQGEDRSPVIDLSNFEMWNDKSGGNGINLVSRTNEDSPQHVDPSKRSQNDLSSTPMAKDAVRSSVPSDGSNTKKGKIDYHSEEMDRNVISDNDTCIDKAFENHSPTSAINPEDNGKNSSDMSHRKFTSCKASSSSKPLSSNPQNSLSQKVGSSINDSCQSAKSKFTRKSATCVGIQSDGKTWSKAIKRELVENMSDLCEQDILDSAQGESSKVKKLYHQNSDKIVVKNEVDSEMKFEIDDLIRTPPDLSDAPSVVAKAGSGFFLELPASLPYTSVMGRSKMGRTVVNLKDPMGRLWSVLYHETSTTCVLTSGWENFCKKNSIQPEDECVFVVENDSEGIYNVQIDRK